ncbi:PP2C family protein-serine/threonine phosphatase [Ferruginibacter sp.]
MLRKNIDFTCTTKKGVNKLENEDAFLVITESLFSLFFVFDGVGSAKNAKKATIISKKFVKNTYKKYLSNSIELDKLLFDLNNYLLNHSLNQLYTTFILLYIPLEGKNLYFSSLGDSRLYGITNQFIEQLSIDDSYSSNVITKCLGLENYQLAEFKLNLIEKDHFSYMLCTDGFYNLMEKEKIFYFETFCKKRLLSIKNTIRKKIANENNDDATIIFIKNICLNQNNN